MIKKTVTSLIVAVLAVAPLAFFVWLQFMFFDLSETSATTWKWVLLGGTIIAFGQSFYMVFREKGPFSKKKSENSNDNG